MNPYVGELNELSISLGLPFDRQKIEIEREKLHISGCARNIGAIGKAIDKERA